MKRVKGLDNDVLYAGHEKPVEQCLDEKWFNWFSDDADLKATLSNAANWCGPEWTAYRAEQLVKDYVSDLLLTDSWAAGTSCLVELLQMCLDYTDWLHLTKRLMDAFGLKVVNQEVLDSA